MYTKYIFSSRAISSGRNERPSVSTKYGRKCSDHCAIIFINNNNKKPKTNKKKQQLYFEKKKKDNLFYFPIMIFWQNKWNLLIKTLSQ